jgi:hypothetical protein
MTIEVHIFLYYNCRQFITNTISNAPALPVFLVAQETILGPRARISNPLTHCVNYPGAMHLPGACVLKSPEPSLF